MRFNRKALEFLFLFCLIVAATTVRPGSALERHAVEAIASVIILLFSLFLFMRDGRRTG
jgi:hypothetical protein